MKHKNVDFTNAAELLAICEKKDITISEAMIQREVAKFDDDRATVEARMLKTLNVMRESVERSQTEKMKLLGGYIGGESKDMMNYMKKNGAMGGVISRAATFAMGVIEWNASMGRIAAAPTAGSSGVLPGILAAMEEAYGFTDEQLTNALFNAGAIG